MTMLLSFYFQTLYTFIVSKNQKSLLNFRITELYLHFNSYLFSVWLLEYEYKNNILKECTYCTTHVVPMRRQSINSMSTTLQYVWHYNSVSLPQAYPVRTQKSRYKHFIAFRLTYLNSSHPLRIHSICTKVYCLCTPVLSPYILL